MADQQRWFKLWASAPSDEDVQCLSPAHRWAWAVFGVYTKVHGTRGQVRVSEQNLALAATMGITQGSLINVIKSFPHMRVEEIPQTVTAPVTDGVIQPMREEMQNKSRTLAVTWNNWHKYQEDTTMAERQKASRSKRRVEKSRGEEKEPPPTPTPSVGWKLNPQLHDAVSQSRFRVFMEDEIWWTAQFRAFDKVDCAGEVAKAEAWCRSNADRAPKRNLKRFLHTWFSRAEERASG